MRNLSVNNAVDRFGIIVVSLLIVAGIFMLSGCSEKDLVIKPGQCAKITRLLMSYEGYWYTEGLVFKLKTIQDSELGTRYSVEFPESFLTKFNTADLSSFDLTEKTIQVDCSVFEDYKQKNKVGKLEENIELLTNKLEYRTRDLNERLEKLEKNATKR